MLEKLLAHQAERGGHEAADPQVMQDIVHSLPLWLEARLNPTMVSAGAILGLSPGDVLVLDHRITQPATVFVAESPIFKGHIGRRGSRLAVAITDEPFLGKTRMRRQPTEAPADPARAHDEQAASEARVREHDARDSEPSPGTVLTAG
jgi:hypothetical protein